MYFGFVLKSSKEETVSRHVFHLDCAQVYCWLDVL